MLVQLGVLMLFQFTGKLLVTLSGIRFPGPPCEMALLDWLSLLPRWAERGIDPVGTALNRQFRPAVYARRD